MATIEQGPVRIELSPLINPPRGLADLNTGDEPAFWRATPVQVQLGIFDALNVAVNLSNLVSLSMVLQESPAGNVIRTKVILAEDITDTISRAGWINGLAQQAVFDLTAAEMDIGLDAEDSKEFWVSFQGLTSQNRPIVYGAGWVRIYNASSQLTPLMPGIVSRHDMINATGNSLIVPSAAIHTERVAITGAASLRNLTIQTAGMTAGQIVNVVLVMDDTADGTEISVYGAAIVGDPLWNFVRNGGETSAVISFTADGIGGLSLIQSRINAY